MTAAMFSFTSTSVRTVRTTHRRRRVPSPRGAAPRRVTLDVVTVVVLAGVVAALAAATAALVKLPLPAGPDLGRLFLDGRLLAGR